MLTNDNIDDVIQEMELLSQQNKFQVETWKNFFDRIDMRSVKAQPKFIHSLGDCLVLKLIDVDLYEYLNEQLDQIAAHLREYRAGQIGSKEMETLEYARSKVESAYRHKQVADRQNARKYYLIIALIAFGLTLLSRIFIIMDERSQERERAERQAQYRETMEQQYEIMEQQQEEMQAQWRDILEANPDLRESVIQQIRELMEDGSVKQEYIDSLLQSYGIDPSELE